MVIRLHSKYRLIAPSLKGDLGAPFELGLFTHRKTNVGNVLDEWYSIVVFSDYPLLAGNRIGILFDDTL